MAIYKCKVTKVIEREIMVDTNEEHTNGWIRNARCEEDGVHDYLVDCADDLAFGEEVGSTFKMEKVSD